MKKLELDIISLTHSTVHNHNYAVILGERYGIRRLPIIIGGFEAQAIAVALERMTPNRPLTHDLLKNVLETLGASLKEVVINDFQEGIFFAQLVCVREGETVEIDSRTSDAIALAVRFDCPIFTHEFILEAAGIVLEEENTPAENTTPKRLLAQHTVTELRTMLQEVLDNEDYEQAAIIRDELQNRGA